MRVTAAVLRGLAGALGSPRVLVWLWLAQLLVALPAALAVGGALERSLGSSRVAETMRDGFDPIWYTEFQAGAEGIAATFGPRLIGAAAFFDNLEAWLWGDLFTGEPALVAVGVGFALLWALLVGAVLERWMRPQSRLSLAGFLAGGGEHWIRFVRLAALTGFGYWGVYRFARWLFPRLETASRDVTAERAVLARYLLATLAVLLLLAGVRLVSDYAKIAIVAGRRRSAVLGAVEGLRFVLRNPLGAWGVALHFAAAGAAALALYALLAPGSGQASWSAVLLSLAGAQLFLLLRLALRVGLLGAEATLYGQAARRRPPPSH